jgi:hypothetical protein
MTNPEAVHAARLATALSEVLDRTEFTDFRWTPEYAMGLDAVEAYRRSHTSRIPYMAKYNYDYKLWEDLHGRQED